MALAVSMTLLMTLVAPVGICGDCDGSGGGPGDR